VFSKYYQSELTYLRELGREFALANPATASMLAERGGDPDVERLLEGFAFLTARIRERMEDDVPEIVHTLTDLLLPHFLRTIPVTSIVEFLPIPGTLRGRHRIARGTELASVPVEGTACRFRTTADVDLLPLTLQDAVFDTSIASSPAIRIQLQTTEQGRSVVFQPDGIRFFIQGDLALAAMLLLWMTRYCKSVTIRGASGRGGAIKLPASNIQLVGFNPDCALLPWPTFAPEGYRLLQEYFTLPSKFFFFDVRGLDAALSASEDRFEMVFQFERPPQLPARVGKEVFRLNCAPVINLFRADADPIRRDPTVYEHLVRASEIDPRHMEVYSVDNVTGLQAGRAERKEYRPFFAFSHAGDLAGDSGYYHVRRARSPIDDGVDLYLSIHTPRDVAPAMTEETLSIDLTCTNRSAAGQLRVGEISVPAPGSPTVAKFKNIVAATRPVRPPFGASLHWRLLSHLAINQRSLADAQVLRAALDLYNFQGVVDRQLGRANRLRTESIRNVAINPVERLFHGIPVRGVGTTIEIEEANFAGEGDVYLFGAVLDELLSAHASVNSFSELTIKLQPSQAEYAWRAKNGRQPIL
jgi:type VI secretion system protein ImpG